MQSTVVDTGENGWTVAVRQRRGALLQRIALGCAVALVVTPMVGVWFSLSWVVLYMACQGIELVVFG
ncbi:MAG: hybrid sensor histidine kinase/response regulator, partial [Brevundimonas sp.]